MSNKRIVITKYEMDYGDEIETLKELLPTMCVAIAYACRATGINPINAFTATSEIFANTKTLEEFGENAENEFLSEIGTPHEKFTNADRIRSMTDDELADFLYCIENFETEEQAKYFKKYHANINDPSNRIYGSLKEWLKKESD